MHLVMELCGGGELFDSIVEAGNFSEKKAAKVGVPESHQQLCSLLSRIPAQHPDPVHSGSMCCDPVAGCLVALGGVQASQVRGPGAACVVIMEHVCVLLC